MACAFSKPEMATLVLTTTIPALAPFPTHLLNLPFWLEAKALVREACPNTPPNGERSVEFDLSRFSLVNRRSQVPRLQFDFRSLNLT